MKQLVNMFKRLIGNAPQSESAEMRSIVVMQRKAHLFTEEELLVAGERGWGKKFDGKDPMFFVSANRPALTVVKAGPHVIRVTSFPCRYADDDEYALSQLPQPEQKDAWSEHHAHTLLDLFNDLSRSERRIPDAEAYASGKTSSTTRRSELHRHLRTRQEHHDAERRHSGARSAVADQ
jgi:hypothetical protein